MYDTKQLYRLTFKFFKLLVKYSAVKIYYLSYIHLLSLFYHAHDIVFFAHLEKEIFFYLSLFEV